MIILTNFHSPNYENTKSTFIIISLLLLGHVVQAQPDSSGQDPMPQQKFNPSKGILIIILIAALFFLGFFSIYIRHCTEVTTDTAGVRTRRILNGSVARSRRAPRGLDPCVIESFPTFDYASVKTAKIGKGALECAVCITEFEDDDTLRLIPQCDHVFHPECIDQWLIGHVTCPVCRANLTEPPVNAPDITALTGSITQTDENNDQSTTTNNIIIINEEESMERPLHGTMRRNRSMMRNISFRRPRWMGKFSRSFSTGHVAVKQWENMDRFTLRLPNEVRKQIMSGKLQRSTSLFVLPRESSTRTGYRTGFGEGTSRYRSGSVGSERVIERSDRWVFSLAPPFITRAPSIKSPKGVSGLGSNRGGSVRGSVREGLTRGHVRSDSTLLPV